MIRAWLASQSLNASMLVGGQGADREAEDLGNVDLTLADRHMFVKSRR